MLNTKVIVSVGPASPGTEEYEERLGEGEILPNTDPHLHVARKIRTMENLQIELVHQVADVLRGVHTGSGRDLSQSIGTLMAMLYYVARQADVPFEGIEQEMLQSLPKLLDKNALDVQTLDYIRRYFSTKR